MTQISHAEWTDRARQLSIDPRPHIGGARCDSAGTGRFDSINPATETAVATYAEGGAEDVARAVSAAQTAFDAGTWSHRPLTERAVVLDAWADLIAADAETLALMDSLEMGMPIAQAMEDVAVSAALLHETAELLRSLTVDAAVSAPGSLALSVAEPLGVVAAITPWNFPLNQALARISAALAMGNAVVLKPSEVAPGSALRAADLAVEAGMPAGVLNVVTGTGPVTGAALVRDPRIARIGFTGSTATGARIQMLAAEGGVPRPLAMELGGKSPHIVCESFTDIEAIAPQIAAGIFWNAGQVCSAGSRLLVHESHAERLIAAICAEAENWVIGDPLDPETTFGPLANRGQFDRLRGLLGSSAAAGTAPRIGGLEQAKGLSMPPTVYTDVAVDSPLASEELFGPVLAVTRFATMEEAAMLANAAGFGLVATVWTRDLAEGHFLARAVRAGSVTIHAAAETHADVPITLPIEPAGRSGFGADFGHAGLLAWSQRKLVQFRTGSP